MRDMEMQLLGYRMTTAEILYHMPDHPHLLQSFVLQKFDHAPEFPVLRKFLTFWEHEIEARIHSVRVAATGLISPVEMRFADGEFRLH
ncbi:MAG: Usg family protein [Alphaproteobacteria bacterium]